MQKVGRPKVEIDFEQLKKLCALQCTLIEIASFFSCSEDTIENRVKEVEGMKFCEFFQIHSAGGKISLRRAQFKAALAGNPSMMIWLGKQHLDQKDKSEQEIMLKDRAFNFNFNNFNVADEE